MNAARRKVLEKISGEILDLTERIQIVRDEEEDAFDNLPDNLKDAEKGEKMSDAIDKMEDAISSLEDTADLINNLVNSQL